PLARNTLEDRPQDTTRRNRYRATSSGLSRRWPRSVQVTPYSFSRPKIRRSIASTYTPSGASPPLTPGAPSGRWSGQAAGELVALGARDGPPTVAAAQGRRLGAAGHGRAARPADRPARRLEGVAERQTLTPGLAEALGDGLRLAAEHRGVGLVHD